MTTRKKTTKKKTAAKSPVRENKFGKELRDGFDRIERSLALVRKRAEEACLGLDRFENEIDKIESIRKRCEEIVAVVERSEILLTKMDATMHCDVRDAAEELRESTKDKLDRLGVPYETTVIQKSSEIGIPPCAASALAEVRAKYLPGARLEAATDRQGRLGRFYSRYGAEFDSPSPTYVDFMQEDEKIRQDILALGMWFSQRDLAVEQEKVAEDC